MKVRVAALALGLATLLVAQPVVAQQIYGTPGSPSATMSINGEQIPPPSQKFGRKIANNMFECGMIP
jgi:hypothetical protein